MAIKIHNNVAIAQCNAFVDAIDAGAGIAKLNVYGGTQPANPGTAAGSSPLVSFDLPNPAFGAASVVGDGAVAEAEAITEVNAAATGTATWARILDRDGNAVADCTVTNTSGSGDVKLSNTDVVAGVESSVISWTFKQPKGWA